MTRVLVTGGTSFVAGHLIARLLTDGYTVRTTVRDRDKTPGLLACLTEAGAPNPQALEVHTADLTHDAGWSDAAAGCDAIMHVASPFPAHAPKHPDDLIKPARDGTLRVLRAARDAGVRRVVMTSSFGAIGYGHSPRHRPFDETDWTNTESPDAGAYVTSKTMAEHAAWTFITHEGAGLELSVINPVGIFGPVLGPRLSASTGIIRAMLNGTMRRCPRLYFGVVDVRDVADLHMRAMTHPEAAGERFLAVAGPCLSMMDVATILHQTQGKAAAKAPTRTIPDWQVKLAALWKPPLRAMLPNLGKIRSATSDKAQARLGWSPRSSEDAIAATAESLIRLGLLP